MHMHWGQDKGNRENERKNDKAVRDKAEGKMQKPGDFCCIFQAIFQGNVEPSEYLEEKQRFEFLKDHTGYRAEKQL